MRESTIETKVCSYARSKGWLTYKFVSPSNRGVPDRIWLKSGKAVFVEFKATGKEPTKLQVKVMKRIQEQDFEVYVVDNVEQGIDLVDRL